MGALSEELVWARQKSSKPCERQLCKGWDGIIGSLCGALKARDDCHFDRVLLYLLHAGIFIQLISHILYLQERNFCPLFASVSLFHIKITLGNQHSKFQVCVAFVNSIYLEYSLLTNQSICFYIGEILGYWFFAFQLLGLSGILNLFYFSP